MAENALACPPQCAVIIGPPSPYFPLHSTAFLRQSCWPDRVRPGGNSRQSHASKNSLRCIFVSDLCGLCGDQVFVAPFHQLLLADGTLAGHGSSMPISARAPPRSARFLLKWTISFMRWFGSCTFQKLCITGETPARKPAIAAAPSFALPPAVCSCRRQPTPHHVATTATSGIRNVLAPAYWPSDLRSFR